MAHRGPSGYPPAYDESSPTHAMDSRRGSSPAIPRLPSLHFSNASTRRGSRSSQSSQAGVDTTQQGEGEIAYPPEYDRPMRSRAELKEQRERLASVYDDVKQELASGKAADMEHFMLRIRAMVQHVDKSAEHPELPGHNLPWEGKFYKVRTKVRNGAEKETVIEIVNATIIRHMNLHGCTYPYISLPYHEVEAHREKEKGRFNVHLNGIPYFQHLGDDVWRSTESKLDFGETAMGPGYLTRTSMYLLRGPGISSPIRVDFYHKRYTAPGT